jgi:hypothetical protein
MGKQMVDNKQLKNISFILWAKAIVLYLTSIEFYTRTVPHVAWLADGALETQS